MGDVSPYTLCASMAILSPLQRTPGTPKRLLSPCRNRHSAADQDATNQQATRTAAGLYGRGEDQEGNRHVNYRLRHSLRKLDSNNSPILLRISRLSKRTYAKSTRHASGHRSEETYLSHRITVYVNLHPGSSRLGM